MSLYATKTKLFDCRLTYIFHFNTVIIDIFESIETFFAVVILSILLDPKKCDISDQVFVKMCIKTKKSDRTIMDLSIIIKLIEDHQK